MEIMMPSLIALLLAVAVAYFVVPRVAPTILVIVGSVILAWAVYVHSTRFGITEYERATWMYRLHEYTGLFFFAGILLGGYFLFFRQSGGSMPPMEMPTTGGGFGTIARTVRSRMGELMRKGRITVN
jgi:hypothetical protein